jgi:hypothetical protein
MFVILESEDHGMGCCCGVNQGTVVVDKIGQLQSIDRDALPCSTASSYTPQSCDSCLFQCQVCHLDDACARPRLHKE